MLMISKDRLMLNNLTPGPFHTNLSVFPDGRIYFCSHRFLFSKKKEGKKLNN